MTGFHRHFLTPGSVADYRAAMTDAIACLEREYGSLRAVYSGKSAANLEDRMARLQPAESRSWRESLDWIGEEVLRHSVVVSHPGSIAHLHCPPLIPALAAEVFISACNQSMDSWDQAPAATYLEQRMIDWLCALYRLGSRSDGVFTSGGTQSNLMGMMLARDHFAKAALGWNIQQNGLPPEAPRFRILSSEISHFSIRQAAAILGLGHAAVVPVAVGPDKAMDPVALEEAIADLRAANLIPIAIAATAGTTDFGSIDPLEELAAIARREGLWLHVDAAYAGALVLSARESGKLAGLEQCDSLTIDFHKLFWQPISCGAFLLRDRAHFSLMRLNADYLNPESNERNILDLVGKSIQTTRRFDSLKLFLSLQVLGPAEFGRMIEATIDLAASTASIIAAHRDFEIANPAPVLNAVVFRYAPAGLDERRLANLNLAIRDRLLAEGVANLAQTKVDGRLFLKMTLLNPLTELPDILTILDRIIAHGGLS